MKAGTCIGLILHVCQDLWTFVCSFTHLFLFCCATAHIGDSAPPSFLRFLNHTQTQSIGWSLLTQHTTDLREGRPCPHRDSKTLVLEIERPQNYALDYTAKGIDHLLISLRNTVNNWQCFLLVCTCFSLYKGVRTKLFVVVLGRNILLKYFVAHIEVPCR